MALTQDTERELRDGRQISVGVKSGVTIYLGAVVEANGNHVQPAAAGASKEYIGVSQSDKTLGGTTDGQNKILVGRRLTAKFKTSGTAPTLGGDAYLVDDETVSADSTSRTKLGRCVGVETDGAWVELD